MASTPTTSLDKALLLLQFLGARGDWTGVRDLARQAGYTPTSVHGLLKVLVAHGFVEFDSERRQYRLGLAVLSLADTMDANDALSSFARPWVQRLADELDETVMALAWRGGRALVVASVEGQHDLRVDPGRRIPDRPHVWASGQVLLAYLPEADREGYIARFCPDQAAAAGLRATLTMIGAQGWAVAHDVDGSGVTAIGAPVLDPSGRCLLSIGCSAPLSRSSAERRQRMRERLCAVAIDMGAALGRIPSTR